MKIFKKFYEAVDLLKKILQQLENHNEKFDEYVYNLNQVQRR